MTEYKLYASKVTSVIFVSLFLLEKFSDFWSSLVGISQSIRNIALFWQTAVYLYLLQNWEDSTGKRLSCKVVFPWNIRQACLVS